MPVAKVRASGGSIEMTLPQQLVKKYNLKGGDLLLINLRGLLRACTPLYQPRQSPSDTKKHMRENYGRQRKEL